MSSKQNQLIAYAVSPYQSDGQSKEQWTRIGVAFPHKQTHGFTLQLDCHPLDGKVVLLPPKAETPPE